MPTGNTGVIINVNVGQCKNVCSNE